MPTPEIHTSDDLAKVLQHLSKTAATEGDQADHRVHRALREHLGTDPVPLPVMSESFPSWDHPNLHLAVESYLGRDGRRTSLIGFTSEQPTWGITLGDLVSPSRSTLMRGPVQYASIRLHDESTLACVQQGIHLVHDGDVPLVMLIVGPARMGFDLSVRLEVMSCDQAAAKRALEEVRGALDEQNVYRGRVVSLAPEQYGRSLSVRFHRLPKVAREEIILPEGLLETIERPTVRFSAHREKLRAAGRHLKRGILLHGPPGTGKTLLAMHLAGRMPDRTVFLLTGQGLGLVGPTCRMARLLQPSTVIMEDVDLAGEERSRQSCNALLFDLLNEMDGLAEDLDVIFLLTTNRPELLEPALASRPGRVDHAIEIPLPDASCRHRLFELYGAGLTMNCAHLDRFVRQTEGVTASFIRELIRRAALFAAEDGGEIVVEDRHLDEALRELAVAGGSLTRSILGASTATGLVDDATSG